MEFAVLAGGVGAARFLSGLVHVKPPEKITVIVNTADDLTSYGLFISPDIDIITYTLAGIVNPEQGWGVAHDSFHCLSMRVSCSAGLLAEFDPLSAEFDALSCYLLFAILASVISSCSAIFFLPCSLR